MADLTPGQIATLGTELSNDPKGLLYSSKNNAAAAVAINQVGLSSEKVNPGVVLAYFFVAAIVDSEWDALTPAQQQKLQLYLSGGSIDTASANVRNALQNIFTVALAPNSRANIVALINRSGSRAEVLFGPNVVVQSWEIGRARGTAT